MNKGFTLAEVLITLGIIGVVAAFTLPTLLSITQGKELETGYKRAYSILNQALLRMERDQGLTVNWDNYPNNTFAPVFKNYLKIAKDCGQIDCYNENSSLIIKGKELEYRTYNKSRKTTLEWFNEGQAILEDGTFLMIQNSSSRQNRIVLSVDVNGVGRGPNCWGHDLFSFQMTNQGKLVPMGSPESDNDWGSAPCSVDDNQHHNGLRCAYRAFTEKDYFKNLP